MSNFPRMPSLQSSIERLAAQGEVEHDPDARRIFLEFRDQLTQGKIRAAEPIGGSAKDKSGGKGGGSSKATATSSAAAAAAAFFRFWRASFLKSSMGFL